MLPRRGARRSLRRAGCARRVRAAPPLQTGTAVAPSRQPQVGSHIFRCRRPSAARDVVDRLAPLHRKRGDIADRVAPRAVAADGHAPLGARAREGGLRDHPERHAPPARVAAVGLSRAPQDIPERHAPVERLLRDLRVLVPLLRGGEQVLLDVGVDLEHRAEAVLREHHRLARRLRAHRAAALALVLEERALAHELADGERLDDEHEALVDDDVDLALEDEEHLAADGPLAHQPLALREGLEREHLHDRRDELVAAAREDGHVLDGVAADVRHDVGRERAVEVGHDLLDLDALGARPRVLEEVEGARPELGGQLLVGHVAEDRVARLVVPRLARVEVGDEHADRADRVREDEDAEAPHGEREEVLAHRDRLDVAAEAGQARDGPVERAQVELERRLDDDAVGVERVALERERDRPERRAERGDEHREARRVVRDREEGAEQPVDAQRRVRRDRGAPLARVREGLQQVGRHRQHLAHVQQPVEPQQRAPLVGAKEEGVERQHRRQRRREAVLARAAADDARVLDEDALVVDEREALVQQQVDQEDDVRRVVGPERPREVAERQRAARAVAELVVAPQEGDRVRHDHDVPRDGEEEHEEPQQPQQPVRQHHEEVVLARPRLGDSDAREPPRRERALARLDIVRELPFERRVLLAAVAAAAERVEPPHRHGRGAAHERRAALDERCLPLLERPVVVLGVLLHPRGAHRRRCVASKGDSTAAATAVVALVTLPQRRLARGGAGDAARLGRVTPIHRPIHRGCKPHDAAASWCWRRLTVAVAQRVAARGGHLAADSSPAHAPAPHVRVGRRL